MRFLYHETTFFICEYKRIKEDKKISYIIMCVMIIIKENYRKKICFISMLSFLLN